MGANLTPTVVKKKAAAVVQLDGTVLIWHMAYDRLVFNGLLFIWGAFKKWACPLSTGS
jgi:hypothetical protein